MLQNVTADVTADQITAYFTKLALQYQICGPIKVTLLSSVKVAYVVFANANVASTIYDVKTIKLPWDKV